MRSFKTFLREQEELEIIKAETEQRKKVVDLIKSIDKFNDAAKELGKEEGEAEQMVYDMLRDFLAKDDINNNGIADDAGLDPESLGLDDVVSSLEGDMEDDIGAGIIDDEEEGEEELTDGDLSVWA